MHAIRHNFWSDERYLTRARFGLELLPSLAEFDALGVITEKSATAPPGRMETPKTPDDASKFPNASPPSYPRSSPTTWTGNASTRRRVWTVYDERTRRIRRRCSTRWTSSARGRGRLASAGSTPRRNPSRRATCSATCSSRRKRQTPEMKTARTPGRAAAAPVSAPSVVDSERLAASRSGGLGRPNSVDYYDRRNSSLHEVFERGLGIPIALSIVYAGVGRRGGLDVRFMNVPGTSCAAFGASTPKDARRGAFAIRSTVDPV